MNRDRLYQWMAIIQRHFTKLKKWQALGLALYVYGVVLAEQSQGSKIAEALVSLGRMGSIERRLRRWLDNERIDMVYCQQAWVRWVTSHHPAPRLLLLVDETKLAARMGVMVVSLAYEGRAIPLVWHCYRANSAVDYPAQGQVWLIVGLLARVLEVLPKDQQVLVQMDRGLAHSSAMLRALQWLGVDFLVRVKDNACFTSRRGTPTLIRQLIQPGQLRTCHGTLFTKTKQVKGTLLLSWEIGQADPWCLFTLDPTLRAADYAFRMWQEEGFRDLKSGGWQWQSCLILDPQHLQRLILVLAIAYAWMLTLASFVFHADETLQRQIYEGKHNKYSVFRTGLRFFKWATAYLNNRCSIYVGLLFAPPFKL